MIYPLVDYNPILSKCFNYPIRYSSDVLRTEMGKYQSKLEELESAQKSQNETIESVQRDNLSLKQLILILNSGILLAY